MVYLFISGDELYYVRIGFIGTRPLVYAVYAASKTTVLPDIKGNMYRSITPLQYEWVRNHLNCDVSYIPGNWLGMDGNLECRTHRCSYNIFTDDPMLVDLWEERQV